MEKKNRIYAVVTGDVVKSSQVEKDDKGKLIDSLKEAFSKIKMQDKKNNKETDVGFNIFRGDSFQGVLFKPEQALRAGLLIRSAMRKNQPSHKEYNWDARLAIGLGTVDHLPENTSEGDGPAYRRSGPVLDELKGDRKLAITTPWGPLNDEFKTSCALLDAVLAKWSAPQAEIIWLLLQGKTTQTMADELDISPTAVHYRVKGAGWFAVKLFLERYLQSTKNAIN